MDTKRKRGRPFGTKESKPRKPRRPRNRKLTHLYIMPETKELLDVAKKNGSELVIIMDTLLRQAVVTADNHDGTYTHTLNLNCRAIASLTNELPRLRQAF